MLLHQHPQHHILQAPTHPRMPLGLLLEQVALEHPWECLLLLPLLPPMQVRHQEWFHHLDKRPDQCPGHIQVGCQVGMNGLTAGAEYACR